VPISCRLAPRYCIEKRRLGVDEKRSRPGRCRTSRCRRSAAVVSSVYGRNKNMPRVTQSPLMVAAPRHLAATLRARRRRQQRRAWTPHEAVIA